MLQEHIKQSVRLLYLKTLGLGKPIESVNITAI